MFRDSPCGVILHSTFQLAEKGNEDHARNAFVCDFVPCCARQQHTAQQQHTHTHTRTQN